MLTFGRGSWARQRKAGPREPHGTLLLTKVRTDLDTHEVRTQVRTQGPGFDRDTQSRNRRRVGAPRSRRPWSARSWGTPRPTVTAATVITLVATEIPHPV